MMEFKPTPEQARIFKFVAKRKENILIEAYAGGGKTSTIVEAINHIPQREDKSVMFLAFNKHIQEELKTRLPEDVRCYTSHGLGLAAIKRKYGDSIEFDEFKLDKHINKISKSWDLFSEFKSEEDRFRYKNNLKKMVNLCRLSLTLDKKYIPYVADRHDIRLDETRGDMKRILKILDSITKDKKTFDYTDMVYMPAVDNSIWLFPQDYVILDEIQDFNRCQIRLVEKMLKKDKVTKKYTGRLISVGDVFQNIYGFVAADERSFQWFRNFPNTKRLPLTYSFRCSKKVIEHANKYVPDIKALENAPEGSVREDGDVLNEARDGDFILCRTTAPLIRLFFEFLEKDKKAIIKGSDVGLQLIELTENLHTIDELNSYWTVKLSNYKSQLKSNGVLNPNEDSGYVAMEDKVNTIMFLARFSDTIEDLKHNIEKIFTDKLQGIVLSTIHKAKGLESDRVFIIRPDLIPLPTQQAWQAAQEKNLAYVAITRAKTELIYDYEWTDEQ